MKSLYESILDDDIMDITDKKVEFVVQFRDMLSKGIGREYNAAKVKRLANEFIKKYDVLPHEDEWPEIVKWFNTYLTMKCVQEAPVEYEMNVHWQPGRGVQKAEYHIDLSAYWRTFYIKDGEQKITKKTAGTKLLSFNYFDTSDWQGKSEEYTLEVSATSDKKWVKRLAAKFNRKPEFDNNGNCHLTL